ncbi:MAG: nucleotidyl transferase AbiEii/AbiGii toxin family protein [Bacteroidales bacterium]|nr:nucleotidyl transferase AbiEii/AbiGii toxin family protein [Bacteroidales bacterium]
MALNIDHHRFILAQILKEIYSNISIAPLLGLKGGTALYLFYNLPRFSVDLDFNLLKTTEKEKVWKKINEILNKFGAIKEKREKRATLFFLLSYEEKAQNVKVKISKRLFPDRYEVKNYLGISMLVLRKEDMFAHKLAALSQRKNVANRDFFDIWFFMKNDWDINKKLVEIRTGKNFKDYLRECVEVVEKMDERYILQGLGEILDTNYKNWVKKNLKKELLFLMKYYSEKNS